MNQSSPAGKVAQSVLAVAIMFLAPTTAALAQTSDADSFQGVLGIWGGILVAGGIISAIAMVAVSGRMGKR